MEKGKKVVDPMLDEEERRLLKALRDYEIIIGQFWVLIQRMNDLMEQMNIVPNEQNPEETQIAYGGEDSASAIKASADELSDTIRRFQREIDYWDCEASTSGSSQVTYQEPEVPLAEQEHEVPPADPKLESSSPKKLCM